MVDIAHQAAINPASARDATPALVPLAAIDPGQWRESSREAHDAGPNDDHAFSFVVLNRLR